jgi:hypothetical protein
MNPPPFFPDDALQARLALPVMKPFVRSKNLFDFNPREPLMSPYGVSMRKKIELQPIDERDRQRLSLREVAQTKGYFLGGLFSGSLFKSNEEVKKEVEELKRKREEEARKPSRLTTFIKDNPELANALASTAMKYFK